MKICRECGINLTDDMFYNHGKTPDGLHTYCKSCCVKRVREWRIKNPQKALKISRVQSKRYPQKMRDNARRYAEKNKDKYRGRAKEWSAKNPKRRKEIKWKYEAKRRGWEKSRGSFTFEEFELIKSKFGYICLCCKKQEPSVCLVPDHVLPLCKGGDNTIENIQPLCKSCNSIKNSNHLDYRTKEIALYV